MRKYSRIPKNIGENIKRLRQKRGVSQVKMAEIVGVTPTYIGFIEQGVRNPSIATVDKIARALKVELSELFK
ncbi:MAG TPA: helix-turn-helix transcriptional regulator [Candidatus Sulfotelmatobacter sp.]|jgi:transcriptional regulator with XRE-family HTH domain|nr:helix-turn-helix transcriptional regulator [Candidatus Sulfotelmatobacter sp.]